MEQPERAACFSCGAAFGAGQSISARVEYVGETTDGQKAYLIKKPTIHDQCGKQAFAPKEDDNEEIPARAQC